LFIETLFRRAGGLAVDFGIFCFLMSLGSIGQKPPAKIVYSGWFALPTGYISD
jgi:hypothetical protein